MSPGSAASYARANVRHGDDAEQSFRSLPEVETNTCAAVAGAARSRASRADVQATASPPTTRITPPAAR
jgi:hypothetical protein